MRLLLKWAIIALALYIATRLVPGIRVSGNGWLVYGSVALILGVINTAVRPILRFFSFPLILLSFGLFTLVINAAMLWLASWIAVEWFEVGFVVTGFKAAFLGALIVSIVSTLLSWMFERKDD